MIVLLGGRIKQTSRIFKDRDKAFQVFVTIFISLFTGQMVTHSPVRHKLYFNYSKKKKRKRKQEEQGLKLYYKLFPTAEGIFRLRVKDSKSPVYSPITHTRR